MTRGRGSGLRLGALRHRDFRLLWVSLLTSAVGTWMQIVAQAVLVLDISHGSAFALGTVSLAQSAAFLAFALFGGAVADRVDKRRLLLVTQSLCMLFATVLGVLTVLHVVAVWMVVVLAFLQGVALSFDQPSRAALVADLVPEDELLNAFSLQSIVVTGASTIGPALAGLLSRRQAWIRGELLLPTRRATWGCWGPFSPSLLPQRGPRRERPRPARSARP